MLIILDKDGTLVQDVNGKPPNTVDEQRPFLGVLERCQQLLAEGHVLAVASNQGGVAYGFIDANEAHLMVQQVAEYIGATHYAVCVCHPAGKIKGANHDSMFRKPNPGMLYYLMDSLGFLPADTVYVGDMNSDREAAVTAGVQFQWAKEFFGRCEPSEQG